ncbi:hypothetical protein T484DRAFT_1750960 [Baffinella frigidus]|nr:hypothetical protein T484DRAFT_1750960 [Cryptophyta sp. CCMP2293]
MSSSMKQNSVGNSSSMPQAGGVCVVTAPLRGDARLCTAVTGWLRVPGAGAGVHCVLAQEADGAMYVKSLLRGGQLSRTVKPSDQLITINGQSVDQRSLAEASPLPACSQDTFRGSRLLASRSGTSSEACPALAASRVEILSPAKRGEWRGCVE